MIKQINKLQDWVRMNFEFIPTRIIAKLMEAGEDIPELTPTDEECDDVLPMWGTMWSFHDELDSSFIQKIAECGFRVFYQEDMGYLIGIDGGGYDFLEAHWLPMYRVFGGKDIA